VVDEGRTAGNPIITSLPGAYETALDAVVSKLPARTTVVSDWNVYRHVKGTPPSGAVPLVSVGTGRQAALGAFFQQVGVTRQCIGRGQLLGWAPKPGEEWHDLLLVEFGWEYLT
jgi:hypothetical protein